MEALIGHEVQFFSTIFLRLLIAFIAGALIGWERERYVDLPLSHHGSIFRMYALVCIGACLYTIAGDIGFSITSAPDRIAAQIVSGVGFLGAGVVLKDNGGIIRGLPTAAGIWVSAAIGLTIGSGQFITGMLGTVFAYLIMDLPHRIPSLFHPKLKMDEFTIDKDIH